MQIWLIPKWKESAGYHHSDELDMNHFQAASYQDAALARDLFSVAHLLIPPTVLFKPSTVAKVVRASLVKHGPPVSAGRAV